MRSVVVVLATALAVAVATVIFQLTDKPPATRAGDRAAIQTTTVVAPGTNPNISGDERYDRLLAYEDGGNVVLAWNAQPTVNAAVPWQASAFRSIGPGHDPRVSGQPGEPPVPPRCVSYVNNGRGYIYWLAGRRTKLGRAESVAIDGRCLWAVYESRGQVFERDLTSGKTVRVARGRQPRIARRGNIVTYVSPRSVVAVKDMRTKKVRAIAPGSFPVISEQGFVVAFLHAGFVYADGHVDPATHTRKPGIYQVSGPGAGPPSIGAGGAYITWEAGGDVWLYTDVRQMTLQENLDANHPPNPVPDSHDPVVSSRGNEVFFVHDGNVYARWLGPR